MPFYHSQIMGDKYLKKIIEEIAKGNEASFRIFFDYYYPRFLRIAHYYVRNNETAEEVVMDVFAKLWKNKKKLTTIVNFNNYTYTLLKNQALNYLKRNSITTELLDEYSTSKMIEYVEPEKLFLGKELAKELEKSISDLPPRCQLIYRMVREDGLKYREVAEALDISVKAVENQLLIAMKRIRSVLKIYMASTSKRKHINRFSLLSIVTFFY